MSEADIFCDVADKRRDSGSPPFRRASPMDVAFGSSKTVTSISDSAASVLLSK